MKWYAIKNPSGGWVEDAVATTEEQAWQYAGDTDHDFPRHPEYHLSESGEEAGYRCVEVELAEPGTTEALKRARLAWGALVSIGARVDCGVANAANADVRDSAMQVLSEVLGLVEANAASDGGDKEAGE